MLLRLSSSSSAPPSSMPIKVRSFSFSSPFSFPNFERKKRNGVASNFLCPLHRRKERRMCHNITHSMIGPVRIIIQRAFFLIFLRVAMAPAVVATWTALAGGNFTATSLNIRRRSGKRRTKKAFILLLDFCCLFGFFGRFHVQYRKNRSSLAFFS